jgi:hypothetical protein
MGAQLVRIVHFSDTWLVSDSDRSIERPSYRSVWRRDSADTLGVSAADGRSRLTARSGAVHADDSTASPNSLGLSAAQDVYLFPLFDGKQLVQSGEPGSPSSVIQFRLTSLSKD